MTRPVEVVTVAFHGAGQLDLCLEQLGTAFATTVVDNSSSPDVGRVAAAHGVTYLDPGTNLGFAAGVNRVVRPRLEGSPADLLLLNPDATVDEKAVRELSRFLHRAGNERVAAVAPRLRHADGAEQRVVWPFPSPMRCWTEAVGLGKLPARRTFLIGAALLLRWEALRDIGPFDERFFLYAEEADWQRQALEKGWRSALAEHLWGTHVGAGSPAEATCREALFHAGQETYIRKWYGSQGWAWYRLAALTGAIIRAAVLIGGRRSAAARRAHLYAKGPRRYAGFSSVG